MSALGWRLLFAVVIAPLTLVLGVTLFAVIVAAAVAWLACGPDERDGAARWDRWTERVLQDTRLGQMTDGLLRKAGIL